MEYAIGGVSLEAVGCIPSNMFEALDMSDSWQRKLSNPTKSKTTIKEAKELIKYGKRMQDAIRAGNTSELLPVLAYYGTGRLWQMEKLTQTKLQATSRSIAYSNCDRLTQERRVLLYQYEHQVKKARQQGDQDYFSKIASQWFQKQWPSYFTTRRILLGQYAETCLQNLAFKG